MHTVENERKFRIVVHRSYPQGTPARLVGESSVIREYEDSLDNPGSSCLWVGDRHHLNREEVVELIQRLQYWLDNKRLPLIGSEVKA